jgi:hypothetical protein
MQLEHLILRKLMIIICQLTILSNLYINPELRKYLSYIHSKFNNKLISVADMFELGWEEGGGAWSWRRRLWSWEEELLEECRQLLNGVTVQANIIDRWQWDPDIQNGYTVRGAYQILITPVSSTTDDNTVLVWHKQVPLKVSIVAWRLLKDRLPTRSNLHRRDNIPTDGVSCVSGCGSEESASHLFIHCDVFGSLWQHVRSWIGVTGVDPLNINDHFFQFIHYTVFSKARRSFLQLLWLLFVWLIWGERNNRIFNNVETPIVQLLDKVKFHSLWWLKAKNTTFVYGTQRWWSDPLLC